MAAPTGYAGLAMIGCIVRRCSPEEGPERSDGGMAESNRGTNPPTFLRSDGAARLALYIVIAVLSAITYHGITDNYLFNDDFSWLSAAHYDMSWNNILTYRVVNFFRPLINLSFFVTELLSPGNIPLHYACNLILHFLNTILVFHLLAALLGRRSVAAATAILFAVSSLHIGAVFWISARTTLLSTALLLLAMIIATREMKREPLRVLLVAVLYALALAAKETAIAGLPLVLLVYAAGRRWRLPHPPTRGVIVSFTVISFVYLIIRKLVMGGFLQHNWGPGLHAARNLAGGFLFQLYPFPLFTILIPQASTIPEPAHPFLPEIVVVALILCILWIGAVTRRLGVFVLAVGWTLLSLLPSCAFRYRFFSTASITQNRYYYLSSVGSLLLITLLLALLWSERSRIRRVACTALFVLLIAGWMLRVHRLEKKWDLYTMMYRDVVTSLVEEIEKRSGFTTIAIEDPPLAFPYIAEAIMLETGNVGRARGPEGTVDDPAATPAGPLERPPYEIVEVRGQTEAAARYKPCLYVYYTGTYPKLMNIETLE